MEITGPSLDDDMADRAEAVIRDMAGTVTTYIDNRNSHPSFGYTKTMIRARFENMVGAIGLYMVLTNQSVHAGVPTLAKYRHAETTEAVQTARRQVEGL